MNGIGRMKSGLLLAFFVLAIGCIAPAFAQQRGDESDKISGVADALEGGADDAYLDPNLYVGIEEAFQRTLKLRQPEVTPEEIQTLFFTLWQHKLLAEQRRIGVRTRGVTQEEMASGLTPRADRPRGIRELSLGGILYTTAENWIVWLNGQRVTPEAIPRQVIDIQVHKEFIELKWFDGYTNLIYPIRLRPHQRFNLDSRIFLPGAPSSTL